MRNSQLYYSTSSDGSTWSNLIRFQVLPTGVRYSTILNFEGNNFLYAAVHNGATNSVVKLYSSNSLSQAAAYQSTILETDSGKFISNLYGLKMNNLYWLAFTLESVFDKNKDIYFISSDSTTTQWTEPILFAKSYRSDDYPVLSKLTTAPFIAFASDRFNAQDSTQIFYGQLGVSEDITFLPIIKKVNLNSIYNYPVYMVTTALVKSFSYNPLFKVSAFTDAGELMQLYDDGAHNDGLRMILFSEILSPSQLIRLIKVFTQSVRMFIIIIVHKCSLEL